MHPFERWRREPLIAPTDVKKQHFYPRMALSRFVRDDGSIRTIALASGRSSIRPSASAVGYELGYFNVVESVAGEAPGSAESWLADADTAAAPILARLIESPSNVTLLTDEEEKSLSRFLAGLRFRSPAFRGELRAIRRNLSERTREMLDAFLAAHPELTEEQRVVWRNADDFLMLPPELAGTDAGIVAEHLGEIEDYAALMRGMDWTIGPASGLFTSDNPVAGAYLSATQGPGGFGDVTYLVPLAPAVLLRLKPNLKGPLEERGARTVRTWSPYDITVAKTLQVAEAENYLYGDGAPAAPDQALARREVFRLMRLRGNEQAIELPGGDPYGKIGYRGVVKFTTPDDPDWYRSGREVPEGFIPLGSRPHRKRGKRRSGP